MLIINRSLTGTVPYIYSEDPAIDKKHLAFSKELYRETRDSKHVPVRDGERPTVFHLKSLSMRRLQRIMSMRNLDGTISPEQYGEAVAFGLKKVDDFEVDGKPFELKLESIGSEERVKNKSLEAIFKQDLFIELGARILELSDLNF
jgi:hypothetical protein